jgi:hypothetical protein
MQEHPSLISELEMSEAETNDLQSFVQTNQLQGFLQTNSDTGWSSKARDTLRDVYRVLRPIIDSTAAFESNEGTWVLHYASLLNLERVDWSPSP